jgi:hypothetical protein
MHNGLQLIELAQAVHSDHSCDATCRVRRRDKESVFISMRRRLGKGLITVGKRLAYGRP